MRGKHSHVVAVWWPSCKLRVQLYSVNRCATWVRVAEPGHFWVDRFPPYVDTRIPAQRKDVANVRLNTSVSRGNLYEYSIAWISQRLLLQLSVCLDRSAFLCVRPLCTHTHRCGRRHILDGSHLPALIVHIPLLLVTDLWLLACIRGPPATHVNAFLLLRGVSKLTAVRISSSVDNLARPGLSNSRTLMKREKKKDI